MRVYLRGVLRERFDGAWCMIAVEEAELLRSAIVSVRCLDLTRDRFIRCSNGTRFRFVGREDATGYCFFHGTNHCGELRILLGESLAPSGEPESFVKAIILHELGHALDYLQDMKSVVDSPVRDAEFSAWVRASEWASAAGAEGLASVCRSLALEEKGLTPPSQLFKRILGV